MIQAIPTMKKFPQVKNKYQRAAKNPLELQNDTIILNDIKNKINELSNFCQFRYIDSSKKLIYFDGLRESRGSKTFASHKEVYLELLGYDQLFNNLFQRCGESIIHKIETMDENEPEIVLHSPSLFIEAIHELDPLTLSQEIQRAGCDSYAILTPIEKEFLSMTDVSYPIPLIEDSKSEEQNPIDKICGRLYNLSKQIGNLSNRSFKKSGFLFMYDSITNRIIQLEPIHQTIQTIFSGITHESVLTFVTGLDQLYSQEIFPMEREAKKLWRSGVVVDQKKVQEEIDRKIDCYISEAMKLNQGGDIREYNIDNTPNVEAIRKNLHQMKKTLNILDANKGKKLTKTQKNILYGQLEDQTDSMVATYLAASIDKPVEEIKKEYRASREKIASQKGYQ